MGFTNYYDVLGFDAAEFDDMAEADIQKELKIAKRELSKLDHPDILRANGASAAEIAGGEDHLKLVNLAYDTLRDPAKRSSHRVEIEMRSATQPKAKASKGAGPQAKPRQKPHPEAKHAPQAEPKPKPQPKAKPQHGAASGEKAGYGAKSARPSARPSAKKAWRRSLTGMLVSSAFRVIAAGVDKTAGYLEEQEDRLRKASWKRADAMALRIALGIPKFIINNGLPATIAFSLMLGAVKVASTPLGHIPEEFVDRSNPICSSEFARNLSTDDFNTVAWLYASTDNPRFRQMLLSNTRAHIETGFNLEYALVQAYIESSWGENVTAETSTARGNHQFLEQSWLERFRKDAATFSPQYAQLAGLIYWGTDARGRPLESNGWRVRDDRAQEILDLRLSDPDLEAFLSLSWRRELHPELVTTQGDMDRTPLRALLEDTNFDVIADAAARIPAIVAGMIHREPPPLSPDELQRATDIITSEEFAAAYRTQLLGPTGAVNFENALDGGARFATASEIFAVQAAANPGLFGRRGQFSFVEVDARIGDKIGEARTAIEDAKAEGIARGGVQRVCDIRLGG